MADKYQRVKCPDCGGLGDISLQGHMIMVGDIALLDCECPWCSIGLMVAAKHGQIVGVETFGTQPSEAEAAAVAANKLIARLS